MKVALSKSQARGEVKAPPSKSYTIRALMCAALAGGQSEIVAPLSSEDTDAAINVLRGIGVRVQREEGLWRVSGGYFQPPEGELHCGDSAATLRFMTAICAVVPGTCRLTAGPSLAKRPVGPLVQALGKLGLECSSAGDLPPVVVGEGFRGGETELPGDISSQFISALLLVAPLAEEGAVIKLTTVLESKPYVLMTLECMDSFGVKVSWDGDRFEIARQQYQPTRYRVEGDWSSAAFFLALGALAGEVKVIGLNPASLQADKAILNLLIEMGATVEVEESTVTVRRSDLRAITADLSDCIDLLPVAAVLAAVARGESQFAGISRARLKESDRVAAVKEGLERMGVSVVEEEDRLTIAGAGPRGAVIDSKGDHRIAMAFGVLGAAVGGTVIQDAECVAKTFPGFWELLEGVGGRVEKTGE